MKKILIIIPLFIFFSYVGFAQLTRATIYDKQYLKNGDTIITSRTPGNWWYGINVEVINSIYFGDFLFPERILIINPNNSVKIKYPDGSYFPGLSLGLMTEYNPPDSKWGFGLKLGLFDYLKNNVTYNVGDSLKKEYTVATTYNYFTFQTYGKYKFTISKNSFWEGFYTFGGVNLEIPSGAETIYKKAFYNPERIEETFNYKLKEQLLRASFQLGLGWDLFDANVEKGGARTVFSPYIAFNMGTKLVKDFGSDQLALNLKVGFSLKLGFDHKKHDTIKFVPREKQQLNIPDVEISEFAFESPTLSKFDYELVYINPIQEEDTIAPMAEPKIDYNPSIEKLKQKIIVDFNKQFIVNYPRSETDVEITKTSEGFFEELASFMKKNPGCIIIIEGYNDDRGGSIRENQRLSILRAENAKQELVNRGISAGRIVSSGKGAIKNIASNETAAGRAKNRRIEIIIKKNQPK